MSLKRKLDYHNLKQKNKIHEDCYARNLRERILELEDKIRNLEEKNALLKAQIKLMEKHVPWIG